MTRPRFTDITESSVVAVWDPVSFNGSSTVFYKLEQSPVELSILWDTIATHIDGLSYLVSGLIFGNTYWFRTAAGVSIIIF